jgi:ribosomal protein S12 methylthiotransferase accessory factor
VERITGLFPVLGITRVANVTGLDRIGLPVVSVCRPNAKSISVDQGKGLDIDSAKASGIMESVEAYLAEHIVLPLRLGSYEDLRYTHNLVDASTLPRSTVARFEATAEMLWIEGYDLARREHAWLPHQMVHLNHALHGLPGEGCFRSTSTGLAAGNNIVEALIHGACEAIERDAVTIWRLQAKEQRLTTRIDLESVDDADCRYVLSLLLDAGIYPAIWDATSDIGVPTYVCQILDPSGGTLLPFSIASGSGCHPVHAIALLRAITEAVQARLTLILGTRDDIATEWYGTRISGRLEGYFKELKSLPSPRQFEQRTLHQSDSLVGDLDWLIERARGVGCQRVVAVDLSRPELGLFGARVVIPGLEDGEDLPSYVPGARAAAAARGTQ